MYRGEVATKPFSFGTKSEFFVQRVCAVEGMALVREQLHLAATQRLRIREHLCQHCGSDAAATMIRVDNDRFDERGWGLVVGEVGNNDERRSTYHRTFDLCDIWSEARLIQHLLPRGAMARRDRSRRPLLMVIMHSNHRNEITGDRWPDVDLGRRRHGSHRRLR